MSDIIAHSLTSLEEIISFSDFNKVTKLNLELTYRILRIANLTSTCFFLKENRSQRK